MSDVGAPLQLISSRISQGFTDIVIHRQAALESAAIIVDCPGPTTCTLVAEQHVQISGTGNGNKWAVCSHVDGSVMTQPLCPYLGELPDGPLDSGSFTQSQSGITPGTHKMRSLVYAKRDATVHDFAIVYSVYSEG